MPDTKTLNVLAESPGIVIHRVVEPGAQVGADDELLIIECMKMEIPVVAPQAGVVRTVNVAPGDRIEEDDVLMVLAIES